MSNTKFTCYSDTHQGCGHHHWSLAKAKACCSVAAKKYDEQREPVPCASRAELEDKYPASPAAQARRDEWLATRKKQDANTEKGPGVDSQDGEGGTPASEGEGSGDAQESSAMDAAQELLDAVNGDGEGEGDAEGGDQSDGQGEGSGADSGDDQDGDQGEGQGEGQGQGDGDGQSNDDHPLRPLATELTPLMADDITGKIEPALTAIADKLAKVANPTMGEVADAKKDLQKVADRARNAIKKHETVIQQAVDAIERIEETKKVEITVTTPEGEQQIEGEAHEMLPRLIKHIAAGENVLMSGPAGSGKTTAAKQVCEALGLDLIVQPVCLDMFQAVGFVDAGGTYRESAVYRWAKAEKPTLLLIDEIDGWNPQALVALNPILDNKLGIFPGGQQFEIKGKKPVIGTANTWCSGATAEYVGRNPLDGASKDRFGARLDWGYDEVFERKLMRAQFGKHGQRAAAASQTVRANLARNGVKIIWGPRQTIGLARRLSVGFTLAEAFESSALAEMSEANRSRNLAGVDLTNPTDVVA